MKVPIRESTGDPCRCRGLLYGWGRWPYLYLRPCERFRVACSSLRSTCIIWAQMRDLSTMIVVSRTLDRSSFRSPPRVSRGSRRHVTGSVSSLSTKCGRTKFQMASGEGVSCRSVQEADTWQPCRFATL